jgi:6-phosphogluconolactonase (cycloisomerase 2 family)
MAPTIMAARLAVAATLAASSVSNQYTILAGGFAGQVSTLHFNATAGSLTVTGGSDKAGLSPGYVCLHPEKNILLATDEDKGTISAFNVSSTGALDFLEQHDAGGLGTVACDVNVVHMQIAVANCAFSSVLVAVVLTDLGRL